MTKATSGVYSISFPGSPNSIYIGQSKNIAKRWKEHISAAKTGKQAHYPINRAFAKYGWHSAVFLILEQCPEDELLDREAHWDSHFKAQGYKMYNTLAGEMKANSEAISVAMGGSSFYLKNWETGQLEWFASNSECARKTGYSSRMVRGLREGKHQRGNNIYSMGPYTLPDCEKPPRLQERGKQGKVTLTKEGERLVFPSQTQAASFLGVHFSAVSQAISRGGKSKGWNITQDNE